MSVIETLDKKKTKRYSDLIRVPRLIKENNEIKYVVWEELGSGSYGKCHKVANFDLTKTFACKMMHKSLLTDPDYQHHIINELKIHESLKHPNIVEFIEYLNVRGDLFIILSLCENRSLRDYVKVRGHTTIDECRYFVRQILMGVCYMHDAGVIHRDLKLTNVLLTDDNRRIKICDFGLAIRSTDPRLDEKHICGTTNYIAPEVFNREGFSFASDIWAVGVMTYVLLFGKLPFLAEHSTDTIRRIGKIKYKLPRNCDQDVEQFISAIFERNQEKRPNARKCLSTQFLSNLSTEIPFSPAHSIDDAWKSPTSHQTMTSLNNKISGRSVYPIIESRAEYIPEKMSMFSLEFLASLQMLSNRFDAICQYNVNHNDIDDNLKDRPHLCPPFCVSKWSYDKQMDEGLIYQMSDNTYGMLCADGLKLMLTPDDDYWAERFGYDEMRKIVPGSAEFKSLEKAIDLFDNCQLRLLEMASLILPASDEFNYYRRLKTPCVYAWFQTTEAIIMLLSNQTIQINFARSHEKLLVSNSNESVTFIEPAAGNGFRFISTDFRTIACQKMCQRKFKMILFFTSAMKYLVDRFNIDQDSF